MNNTTQKLIELCAVLLAAYDPDSEEYKLFFAKFAALRAEAENHQPELTSDIWFKKGYASGVLDMLKTKKEKTPKEFQEWYDSYPSSIPNNSITYGQIVWNAAQAALLAGGIRVWSRQAAGGIWADQVNISDRSPANATLIKDGAAR